MMRRRLARSLAAVSAGVLAAGLLTACSAEDEGRLTYWAVNMGPTLAQSTEVLEREMAEFTDRTGVDVDLEVIEWVDLYQRIMTAVSSGRTPDVVNIGNSWSASLQDTQALLPIDDDALEAIGGADKFLAPTLTATGAAGEPPASVPYLGQAHALYYSPSTLAEAGIDTPPETWEDVVAAARVLQQRGHRALAIGAGNAARTAQLTFILGRQQGARLFDDHGRAQFDTASLRRAVRALVDLAEVGALDPADVERTAPTDDLAALAQGRVAMTVNQANGRGYFESVGFDDYEVVPLPVPGRLPAGGAAVRSAVAGTNLAIFADTRHRAEALELVGFLTSTSAQIELNKTFGTLPVVHAAYDAPEFADPALVTFGRILAKHAEAMPMVPSERQMEQVLGAAVRDLVADGVRGEVSDAEIAAALHRAERQMAAP